MMLFLLQRLALVHQALILALGNGVREEGVYALADPSFLEFFQDGLTQFVGFRLDFCWHNVFRSE